ncbi:MAG: hypothetical protein FP833_08390 [Atribacteria sp.]|nr:hypothetical protein [Candidatus Atribacteria bacterium]
MDNMKNKGIIAILVGVGVIFISILFASGYSSYSDLITNIYKMEIELYEGRKTKIRKAKEKYRYMYKPGAMEAWREKKKKGTKDMSEFLKFFENYPKEDVPEKYVEYEEKYVIKGRVAIPLKYPFSLSVLLILFGTGILLLSKKRK